MKRILPFLLLFYAQTTFAQSPPPDKLVQTEIKAANVFELSIVKVFPDSFPLVSVVFQAKNVFGKPLWTLDKSEITVSENQYPCEVVRLRNISENRPVNIGLVLDHSMSMVDDPKQMKDGNATMQYHYILGAAFPKGYVMPIQYAKDGIKGFLNESKSTADSILFVGFSDVVDKVIPLTNDTKRIQSFVSKVQPDGNTAFYDALYAAIEQLGEKNKQSVVVALTDGGDNASTHTHQEVIALANTHDIRIFIIGLGNVLPEPLQLLTSETSGFYYPTNDPKKLSEIYLNIKAQIKSIYQVDYTSTNDNPDFERRNIRFSFVNDTLTFANQPAFYSLPAEAKAHLEQRKQEEASRVTNNRILLGGAGALVLLLGIGGFVIARRKNKSPAKLKKAFPNPFQDEINLAYSLSVDTEKAQLVVTDMQGMIVSGIRLSPGASTETVRLGHLPTGTYLLQIRSDQGVSAVTKVVKQ